MEQQIVQIRDIKADVWAAPQFIRSLGGYTRGLTDLINGEQNNDLAKHPEDFEAFHVGTWDDNTNKLQLFETPRSLGPLTNYVIHRN